VVGSTEEARKEFKNSIHMQQRRSRFWKGRTANAEISSFSKLYELIDTYEPRKFKPSPDSKIKLENYV
jgi:hypothetical protein